MGNKKGLPQLQEVLNLLQAITPEELEKLTEEEKRECLAYIGEMEETSKRMLQKLQEVPTRGE